MFRLFILFFLVYVVVQTLLNATGCYNHDIQVVDTRLTGDATSPTPTVTAACVVEPAGVLIELEFDLPTAYPQGRLGARVRERRGHAAVVAVLGALASPQGLQAAADETVGSWARLTDVCQRVKARASAQV